VQLSSNWLLKEGAITNVISNSDPLYRTHILNLHASIYTARFIKKRLYIHSYVPDLDPVDPSLPVIGSRVHYPELPIRGSGFIWNIQIFIILFFSKIQRNFLKNITIFPVLMINLPVPYYRTYLKSYFISMATKMSRQDPDP
jgi:hypothetical protein